MNRTTHRKLAAVLATLALAACSGGAMDPTAAASDQPSTQTSIYAATGLVSDGAVPAAHVDADLHNPWGIVFNPIGPVWVANNGSNTSTLYTDHGAKFPLTVRIPPGSRGDANPTGIVYNGNLLEFLIDKGLQLGSAEFIFAGEGGTIAAWSQTSVTLNQSETMYDDGAGGAVYKGLALAAQGGSDFLYATDFHNAKIDVFDSHFKKLTSAGGFRDPALPAGYAPFGIQAINGKLYVSYAQQKAPENHDEVDGAGFGLVYVYDTGGKLLQRLATGGALNAPWGIALAPAGFGQFSGDLLVSNFGDGSIAAYDPGTGAFAGNLLDAQGKLLLIPKLWGLAFGNGLFNQPRNALFFTAGPNDEADGLYGRIDASPKK